MKKILFLATLVFMTTITGFFSSSADVAAFGGTVYGRYEWRGYFSGGMSDYYGDSVLRDYPGYSQALPSFINTVPEFVNRLKDLNNNSNNWDRTGSSAVVCTILGYGGGSCPLGSGRDVPDWMWTNLTNGLNSANIDWGATVSNNIGGECINSMYDANVSGMGDVVWYDNSSSCKNEAGIIIRNTDGSIAYRLLRRCANPVGRTPTDLKYVQLDGRSRVTGRDRANATYPWVTEYGPSTLSAFPGDTVTYRHEIRNSGYSWVGNVTWQTRWKYFSGSYAPTGNSNTRDFGGNSGWVDLAAAAEAYTVPLDPNLNGQTRCQRIEWNKDNGGTAGYTNNDAVKSCIQMILRYNLVPDLSTSQATASPGDVVNFTYQFDNQSGTAASTGSISRDNIRIRIVDVRINPGASVPTNSGWWNDYTCGQFNIDYSGQAVCNGAIYSTDTAGYYNQGTTNLNGSITSTSAKSITIPTNAVHNSKICRAIQYNNPRHDATYWRFSRPQCVTVLNDYNLVPTTAVNPSPTANPGGTANITYGVSNTGGSGAPGTHSWRVTKIVYGPGQGPSYSNFNSNSVADACGSLAGTNVSCANNWRSGSQDFSSANLGPVTVPQPIPSDPIGTKICYVTSVQQPTSAITNWRYSALRCMTLSKQPKLQVHGGDVRVLDSLPDDVDPATPEDNCDEDGHIYTSITSDGTTNYGSWSEFGALSRCINSNLSTGKGLLTGNTSTAQEDWSPLTFRNSNLPPAAPTFGWYAASSGVYNPATSLFSSCAAVPGATVLTSIADLPTPTAVDKTYCIDGGSEVVITDPVIQLANTPTKVADMPQVIIIADSIKIRPGVTRVDAWMIADRLYTCVNASNNRLEPLTTATCPNQLVVNGPVYAGKLYADRTYGADLSTGRMAQSAEVFNLPASSTIWYRELLRQNSNRIDVVSIKEIPPRY